MAIYKNGKPYQLFSRPNPLVREQLSVNNLKVHNMKWNSTTNTNKIEDQKVKIPEPVEGIVEKMDTSPELIESKEVESYAVQDKDILILHVLPVKYTEFQDLLYGEIRKNKTFGEKYIVESVLVDVSITGIKLITQEQIPENYIIFPSKYKDGKSSGMKTWWKIISSHPEDENYLTTGIISDFHPSFSD